MSELNDIKALIAQEDFAQAETLLKAYLSNNHESEQAHFLLGNLYRKREDWEGALNEYQAAMDINENSPARLAYNAIQEVLAFYNKDMFNQ
ncbi:MAG: tetratricopeptide repeat protein [Paludibacteraceae bacterium]|nr:tetratricopeptide repeat protein [Paludibacteraceae bacterium]